MGGIIVADIMTVAERSRNMSLIHGKNTRPEMQVRRLVHSMGYRYRLHVRHLPGKPDLVFSGKRKVIFVHGCFWHLHANCQVGRIPKTRIEFWTEKLQKNVERDKRNHAELHKLGWDVLVVWECEMSNSQRMQKLTRRLKKFLERTTPEGQLCKT